ncbi:MULTISPECIES: FtsK/SpoIIIE domain-containing protein [unclassified Amycolatopsis]|uniref:FtsK/SpoIIIE domain-containing protein n=1 Tax=unclassified Amycolatopsis TaxID=2618356 RepID=UPI002874E9D8|nr:MULTISPECIES: FtsK/SpoIIIE domain-containing protein [unclassified Amycolatopsis]MDS0133614.1 cell division protein FtsK [Amycolatopsis sp. 505]MDS0148541.1 cell division protein FtsK [Amycolatopsis sp. CM201R]
MSPGFAVVALAGLGLGVWVLHKVGRALASILEALAAAAVVFVALWWLCKAVVWMLAQVVTRWRTSLAVVAVYAWCELVGWLSLAITLGSVAVILAAWWAIDAVSFDQWCGRFLRSWWSRWAVYGRKLPEWLHACGLSVRDEALPVVVNVNLVGRRRALSRSTSPRSGTRLPKVLGVRSGASWDEVRVELVAGQKPEDFDEAARALAVARKVARCQVRELAPNVVSIDFQRRDLLSGGVAGPQVPDGVDSTGVDLRNVWAGRTEYGRDWRVPLLGSGAHCLTAGASGAGKNSVMWCPLVAAAPAIRAEVVRMSGIDPKGMELAYGRGIFSRYAVGGKDAVELLDDLVEEMESRKRAFAGRLRTIPVSTEYPLELLEFDEIGALTKYTDRKTREAIVERVALLTTQGRALGISVRGYVQEPTKDTVPVRELFTRRVCLRVTSKTHVGMVLGDGAYERGAWANRIGDSEAGVGYVWGEGIREPLRIRAGWVSDATVKALEAYVTNGGVADLRHGGEGVAA